MVVNDAAGERFTVDATVSIKGRLPVAGQPLEVRIQLRATSGALRFTLADLTARTLGGQVVRARPVPGHGNKMMEGTIQEGQVLQGNVALYIPRGTFVLSLSLPAALAITWQRTN
jgi:hypothetical protein